VVSIFKLIEGEQAFVPAQAATAAPVKPAARPVAVRASRPAPKKPAPTPAVAPPKPKKIATSNGNDEWEEF